MKYFEMAATCGCCMAVLAFESEEKLLAAFGNKLTSTAVVTDDEGVLHEGIDTFNGFRDITIEKKRADRKARKEKGKKRR